MRSEALSQGESIKNGWFSVENPSKMDDLGPPKVDTILSAGFFPFFNSKCMTWVSLWAILSAWFKYHWGAILSACHHVLRILTARRPLYIYIYYILYTCDCCMYWKFTKKSWKHVYKQTFVDYNMYSMLNQIDWTWVCYFLTDFRQLKHPWAL